MPTKVLIALYNAFVFLPYLTLLLSGVAFCTKTISANLQRVQNYCIVRMFGGGKIWQMNTTSPN